VVDMVFGNGDKYSLAPENYMFRVSHTRLFICSFSCVYRLVQWLSNVNDSIFPTFHGAILHEAFKSARSILSRDFPKWKRPYYSVRRYLHMNLFPL